MMPAKALRMCQAAGASGDPFFANVSLLCHFDGTNGSTTSVDSSASARTSTAHGGVSLDTSDFVFATASGKFVASGTPGVGSNWNYPNSTDFEFGSASFTLEGRLKASSSGSLRFVLANRASVGFDAGFYLYVDGTSHLNFRAAAGTGGANIISLTSVSTISSSVWVPWCIAYDAATTTARMFLSGTVDQTASSITGSIGTSAELLYVGSSGGEDGTRDWDGHQDELRITKGVCRYVANYSPAVTPFPDF